MRSSIASWPTMTRRISYRTASAVWRASIASLIVSRTGRVARGGLPRGGLPRGGLPRGGAAGRESATLVSAPVGTGGGMLLVW